MCPASSMALSRASTVSTRPYTSSVSPDGGEGTCTTLMTSGSTRAQYSGGSLPQSCTRSNPTCLATAFTCSMGWSAKSPTSLGAAPCLPSRKAEASAAPVSGGM